MQTKEPRKRTNTKLVIIIIILIPLIIFLLILTNTSSQQTGEKMKDSVKVGNNQIDTTHITTKPDATRK